MKNQFTIKLEAWDRMGQNLGRDIHLENIRSLEAAKAIARKMYKSRFVGQRKMMKIWHGDSLVWKFENGKETYYDKEEKRSH